MSENTNTTGESRPQSEPVDRAREVERAAYRAQSHVTLLQQFLFDEGMNSDVRIGRMGVLDLANVAETIRRELDFITQHAGDLQVAPGCAR